MECRAAKGREGTGGQRSIATERSESGKSIEAMPSRPKAAKAQALGVGPQRKVKNGGRREARTRDLRVANAALSQLS